MDPQLEQDLNEIADMIGSKLPTLMPSLQAEMEGTPAWQPCQILGSYLHYRLEGQDILGKSAEHYAEVHHHALAHTLALELTQDFMQNVIKDSFNMMAGVQPEPSFEMGDFQEENL